MINLKLKNGKELSYSEEEDKVYLDGKYDKDWVAAFVPNGDDEPSFFGFTNLKEGKCYDIFGGVSNVIQEDNLKL